MLHGTVNIKYVQNVSFILFLITAALSQKACIRLNIPKYVPCPRTRRKQHPVELQSNRKFKGLEGALLKPVTDQCLLTLRVVRNMTGILTFNVVMVWICRVPSIHYWGRHCQQCAFCTRCNS